MGDEPLRGSLGLLFTKMNPLAHPEREAANLIELLGSNRKAIEHAQWAYENVEKPATKAFWIKVIKEIEKEKYDGGNKC